MIGSKVFVYFNLHKHVWSIRSRERANYGRVIAHASHVLIMDPEFKVGTKGRERVLATGAKNVHAGVAGVLVSADQCQTVPCDPMFDGACVSYNPFKSATFYDRATGNPVRSADSCALYSNGSDRNILAYGARS